MSTPASSKGPSDYGGTPENAAKDHGRVRPKRKDVGEPAHQAIDSTRKVEQRGFKERVRGWFQGLRGAKQPSQRIEVVTINDQRVRVEIKGDPNRYTEYQKLDEPLKRKDPSHVSFWNSAILAAEHTAGQEKPTRTMERFALNTGVFSKTPQELTDISGAQFRDYTGMLDGVIPVHFEQGVSSERLAQHVREGSDVIVAVNRGVLLSNNDLTFIDEGRKHAVLITAVAYKPGTTEVVGFIVHDPTTDAQARRVIGVDTFEAARGAAANDELIVTERSSEGGANVPMSRDDNGSTTYGDVEGFAALHHIQGVRVGDKTYIDMSDTCVAVGVEILVKKSGGSVTKADVLTLAKQKKLIGEGDGASLEMNLQDGVRLLKDYSLSAHFEGYDSSESSPLPPLDRLAQHVEAGRGVIATVNPYDLNEELILHYESNARHAIVVAGTRRSSEGRLEGFDVIDSANFKPHIFVPVDVMEEAWQKAGAACVVTDTPLVEAPHVAQ